MKILIASLQVSESGSKGHLHPAIELALEAKRRGHSPYLLPLPSPLGVDDAAQVQRAGIEYLVPPPLPSHIIQSPKELARLAASKDDVWKAYHSFLVAPLAFQYQGVRDLIEKLRPDALIYDLLVYAAPITARSFNIPDTGFCAGLKLIAPERFQQSYRNISRQLQGELSAFLSSVGAEAKFKHLELLSNHAQVVFSTEAMIPRIDNRSERTQLVGPIHISPSRGDTNYEAIIPKERFAVLSFGSVLDPADFPDLTATIIRAASQLSLRLLIGSSKLRSSEPHVTIQPYLPLTSLLPHASAYFHHGGANSFSEALYLSVPQVLIPLTTDQPIQGYFLQESQVGFTLPPSDASVSTLFPILQRLLNMNDPIHLRIHEMSRNYQSNRGQKGVIDIVEATVEERL